MRSENSLLIFMLGHVGTFLNCHHLSATPCYPGPPSPFKRHLLFCKNFTLHMTKKERPHCPIASFGCMANFVLDKENTSKAAQIKPNDTA